MCARLSRRAPVDWNQAAEQLADSRSIREALLQETAGTRVRCLTCERRCTLADGQVGWCRTRQNRDGTLVTMTYGMVSSLSANPIEKKPLHHFYPGSHALTAGSWSCNFACPWCQNWDISKAPPSGGVFYPPERFVAEALRRDCQGTSISLNEPTLSLEWSLEVFQAARQAGLYNTFVTNGYMTEPALDRLAQAGLDAMNVDVKGEAEAVQTYCETDVEVVWRNLRRARDWGNWIEITTLVIPGVNDDSRSLADIASRILGELGPDTPWHLSRYQPAFHFSAPPTPVRTLEQARASAQERGLRYVYLGNVPGNEGENTFCPSCGCILVRRHAVWCRENRVRHGRCPGCAEEVPGVGWDWRSDP